MSMQQGDENPVTDEDEAKPSSYAHVVARANANYDDEDAICAVKSDEDDKFKKQHEAKIECIGRRLTKPPTQFKPANEPLHSQHEVKSRIKTHKRYLCS